MLKPNQVPVSLFGTCPWCRSSISDSDVPAASLLIVIDANARCNALQDSLGQHIHGTLPTKPCCAAEVA
jgi:hypothetical protein